MRPYLSLVIPYYNSAETIGRLLTSIAKSAQAPTFEVLVVDDGSRLPMRKDYMPDVCRQRRLAVRFVRLVRNVGPAVARNRGVARARGKFIVFLDGDVELFSDTLHNLAKGFQDDPDVGA